MPRCCLINYVHTWKTRIPRVAIFKKVKGVIKKGPILTHEKFTNMSSLHTASTTLTLVTVTFTVTDNW